MLPVGKQLSFGRVTKQRLVTHTQIISLHFPKLKKPLPSIIKKKKPQEKCKLGLFPKIIPVF